MSRRSRSTIREGGEWRLGPAPRLVDRPTFAYADGAMTGFKRLSKYLLAALVPMAPAAAAAQSQVAISMAPPPPAPHIVGARVLGALPLAPIVHRVAATGQRPMTFAAAGLPAGLSIDSATGIITGAVASAGRYVATITATNGAGADQKPLTLEVGTTLARTPPMGWNSYDSYDDAVTEADVVGAGQTLVALLQPSGWNHVVVDYRWYDPNAPASNQNQPTINTALVIDGNGRFLPAPNRFPSATGALGFKPLADQIHAMGLQFGIHIMRGIPRRAVLANTPIAGSTFHAADAANTADVSPWNSDMYGVNGNTPAGNAWYDSIVQQYADWGVDFIKVDDLLNNQVTPNLYHQSEVDAVRRAIDKTGKAIVFSVSPGEVPVSSAVDLVANANIWRMANDFWDIPSSLDHMFALALAWEGTNGPGHWPDADMLPFGYLGPHCPVGGNRSTRFTKNEQVSVMSLWAILPSPLMLGANLPSLRADAWTTALLTNDEVLAINQDSLGKRARQVASNAGATQEVWARDLDTGPIAVALFNHATTDAQVSVTFAQLGVPASSHVRDLWARADVAVSGGTGGLSALVPYRGAALFLVTPGQTSVDGGVADGGADEGSGVDGGGDATLSRDTGGPGIGPDASGSTPSEASFSAGSDATVDAAGAEGGGMAGSAVDGPDDAPRAGEAPASTAPTSNGCSCSLPGRRVRGRLADGASWIGCLLAVGAVRRRGTRAPVGRREALTGRLRRTPKVAK